MYALVPAEKGVPKVGRARVVQAIGLTDTQAIAQIEGEIQPGWIEITEEEFRQYVPIPVPEPAPETTEEKLARLEEQNFILMDALATTFEEILALRAIVEGGSS